MLANDVVKNNERLPWLAASEKRLGETDLNGEHVWLCSQRRAKFLSRSDELAARERTASDRVMGHGRGERVEFHAAAPAPRGVAPDAESSVKSRQSGEDIRTPWVQAHEAVQLRDALCDA